MARELTERQRELLQRLALVPEGMLFKCGGHARIGCGSLVKRGYAKCVAKNIDDGFASAYQITYSGKCWLEAHGLPSKPKQ